MRELYKKMLRVCGQIGLPGDVIGFSNNGEITMNLPANYKSNEGDLYRTAQLYSLAKSNGLIARVDEQNAEDRYFRRKRMVFFRPSALTILVVPLDSKKNFPDTYILTFKSISQDPKTDERTK